MATIIEVQNDGQLLEVIDTPVKTIRDLRTNDVFAKIDDVLLFLYEYRTKFGRCIEVEKMIDCFQKLKN